MQITIAAIGSPKKKSPEAMMIADYQQKFIATGRQIGFKGLEIKDFEPKNLPQTQRMAQEAEWLWAQVKDADQVIYLDEHAPAMRSEKFAKQLNQYKDQSFGHLAFVIGGPDGYAPELRDRFTSKNGFSFGVQTWPHMLVRVMLTEQLFRAAAILTNHPYHRGDMK